jgi:hypothetical protein
MPNNHLWTLVLPCVLLLQTRRAKAEKNLSFFPYLQSEVCNSPWPGQMDVFQGTWPWCAHSQFRLLSQIGKSTHPLIDCKSWIEVKICYLGVIRFLFFDRTLIFDWCVFRWRSKNKCHKGTCIIEVWLHLQFLVIYSTLNNERCQEDLRLQ